MTTTTLKLKTHKLVNGASVSYLYDSAGRLVDSAVSEKATWVRSIREAELLRLVDEDCGVVA